VTTLRDIDRCFQRVLPGVIATADRDGIPNVNYVTQIQVVDERYLALSYQFPTKTRLNLEANPFATLEVHDPLTLDAYRLALRFDRAETSGALFDLLASRIEAIASHTGLANVFRLRAAYICEVLSIEHRTRFFEDAGTPAPRGEPLSEVRGLALVSERISRARDLDDLLTGTLATLDEAFGFSHGAIFVPEGDDRLIAIASHGYDDGSIGAEVQIGDGLIGVVAKTRSPMRVLGLDANLAYSRQVRAEWKRRADAQLVREMARAEIPLPGLPDARSQMAIPLLMQDRLLGVIALECRDTATFAQWHETFLVVLANQIASAMANLPDEEIDDEHEVRHAFTYYRNDDCVFVDGEYLIRNVPAKILWKLLREFGRDHRTEFSNRELRLDPSLGLPSVKDNLESRLILLRKRLEQKCPEVRVVPTRRGKFALEVGCAIELVERETA
jgi:uncharacterized protein YigA (DUF484 family)